MPLTTGQAIGRLPSIQLTLFDGVERDYLLDTPAALPTPSGGPAYDHRVHAAYVLAMQGYDAEWLGRFAELPREATRRITSAAAMARTAAIKSSPVLHDG